MRTRSMAVMETTASLEAMALTHLSATTATTIWTAARATICSMLGTAMTNSTVDRASTRLLRGPATTPWWVAQALTPSMEDGVLTHAVTRQIPLWVVKA